MLIFIQTDMINLSFFFLSKKLLDCDLIVFIVYSYIQAHVKVLSIYCDENKARRAGPGENVRVKVSGVEEEDILSGFVLSSIGMCCILFKSIF